MPTVSVRYIVNDIDAAIVFYCSRLGFHEEMHPNAFFASPAAGLAAARHWPMAGCPSQVAGTVFRSSG